MAPDDSYVQKAGEENRRYLRELLGENEHLRSLLASLRATHTDLEDEVRLTRHVLDDHDSLRSTIDTLIDEKRLLRDEVVRLQVEATLRRDREVLERQRADVDGQNRRFARELRDVERRNNDLASLYTASYRLHHTLDRDAVLATVGEIVADLVGCEEHAVFELDERSGALQLVAWAGIEQERYASVPLGEGPIGAPVASGETWVAERDAVEPGDMTACVPLKLDGRVTGAIVLFRLLPQKALLGEVDHEMLGLLAAHVAPALYCTKLHLSTIGA